MIAKAPERQTSISHRPDSGRDFIGFSRDAEDTEKTCTTGGKRSRGGKPEGKEVKPEEAKNHFPAYFAERPQQWKKRGSMEIR